MMQEAGKDKKQIIILGGGFGGLAAARTLHTDTVHLTLIDKTNHHLFQPLLYQVATAALSPGDISEPVRAVLSGKKNTTIVLGEVTQIDPGNNCLQLANGRTFKYDFLVVAVGAEYSYFGHTQWEQFAPGLKTLDDALKIRERILLSLEEAEQIEERQKRKPYLTFVIIGGGPTGVEMAGAIAEIAKRNIMRDYAAFDIEETCIYLLEAGPRLLNGFDVELSNKARNYLEQMGVNVLLNSPVRKVERNAVTIGDTVIESMNIIWAAGVVARPLLTNLSGEQDANGRIKVTRDLRHPDFQNIFIIGDAAHCPDAHGNPLPALAPVAIQQGRFVGKLLNESAAKNSKEATRAFVYVDKGKMATVGRAKAVAEINDKKFSGFFAWLLWSVIHIFYLIGFRNRVRVFLEWIWFYFTFKRGVRLITNRALDKEKMPSDSK